MSTPTAQLGTSLPVAHSIALIIPHQRSKKWTNWGRTAQCQPDYTCYPRTLEDLVTVIHFARENGLRIRAVGSGHAWSALVPTQEILVAVENLNRVSIDLSNPDNPCVVMESGATVRQVNDVLEAHGYALPYNVVLESVRFGGLISTGSHGSGWNHQTLSDLVEWIEIVTAAGELVRFEASTHGEEVMSAARMALGMFGLVYRIKLRVQKSWVVRRLDRRVSVTETLQHMHEWVPQHDNMDIFWWPFQDRFWLKSWHRTDAPTTAKPRRNPLENLSSQIECQLLYHTMSLLTPFPRLTRAISDTAFRFTPSQNDQVVDVVEAIHYRRGIERVLTGCLEVAFKLDADFANVRWAMQLVIDETERLSKQGKFPFNLTMNVRFINNSNCLLSPAYGEGHTCYIEILSRTHQPTWEAFSGQIAKEWLTLPHALPHWAKEYEYIPGVVPHIKREMAANLATFNRIKTQLGVDPTHMFVNDTLRDVFLPS